jgi:CheY-like chemotaxis protein
MSATPVETPPSLRIVAVEDRPDNLLALCKLLQALGHIIVGEAGTGEEAITVMDRLGNDGADIVFMDLDMPPAKGLPREKDAGITVSREIFNRRVVPSIICSGLSEGDIPAEWADECQILYYLRKPPDITNLRFALAAARRDTKTRALYATLDAARAYVAVRTDSTIWDAHERLYNGAKRTQMNLFDFAQKTLEALQGTYRTLGYDYK